MNHPSPERGLPERPAKTLYVQQRFFEMIQKGLKTAELRLSRDVPPGISPGVLLQFACASGSVVARIKTIRRYSSLEELFQVENGELIAPGMDRDELGRLGEQLFSKGLRQGYHLVVIAFKLE